MKNKLLILLLIFSFLLTSGFGCKGADKATQEAMKPVTLNYWRVWDGPDAFSEIIAKYKQSHPYININYRKLRYGEYEQALLEAMAEDKGPDILSLHNTWIKKYQSKLNSRKLYTVTMPATKYIFDTGNLTSRTSLEKKTLITNPAMPIHLRRTSQ